MSKMLTPTEAAAALRVTRYTVLDWARRGLLPAVRLTPRKILFEESALQGVIDQSRHAGRAPAQVPA